MMVHRVMKDIVFIAIGVRQGDAFFMEKRNRKLLVDGGNSRVVFPRQFVRVTGRTHVNVLVCTHNDSDHARGVLGFLRNKRLFADEVWLPASWMDRLRDIIHKPKDFMKELMTNVEKLSDNLLSDLSGLGDEYTTTRAEKEDLFVEVKVKDLLEPSEQADAMESVLRRFYRSQHYLYGLQPSNKRLKLIVEAVSASDLIRQIVLAAYRSGSLIRWFDYIGNNNQINASGGIHDLLQPVNAVEVVRIRRPKRSALEYIALTRSNKQSLVFMSPKDKLSSGVLFTADSNLSFSQVVPWHDRMIITSPHHGSESNKYAYMRFFQETAGEIDVVWVRSDGKFIHRPGKSYLGVSGRKYCTLCRGCKLPKQNVKMVFSILNYVWKPIKTRKCRCV